MQTLYRAARFVLPVAFLGYGAFVNYALVTQGRLVVDPTVRPLSGGLTAQIDEVYKKGLPLRDAAVGLVGAVRYALIGEGRKGVLVAPDGWLFTAEEATAMTEPMAAPVARIAAIRDQLAAMGTTLVVVPLPAKSDIQADHANWPDLSAAQAERHAAFLQALDGAGVATVDLRPPCCRRPKPGRPSLPPTPTGRSKAPPSPPRPWPRRCATRGLPPDPQEYRAQQDGSDGFTGDLVSFVTTPGMAPLLGLDSETVRPLRAVAAAPATLAADDLFGAAASGGIALVGTSYSANLRWSFADSLILALGADVLNHAQEGRGPARPVFDMLADPPSPRRARAGDLGIPGPLPGRPDDLGEGGHRPWHLTCAAFRPLRRC